MTVTELIAALEAVREQDGDLTVVQREGCSGRITLFEPACVPSPAYFLPAEDLEPLLRYETSDDDGGGELFLLIGKAFD